eukprot:CAMPEP_0179423580 /NCGR_PEP_ID=MMETSP0799-20121207/11095_1 /TAXON_ID=46947 /ORGANISM="Geminigera cryophila, Strain CCMP2564" /LENGTH=37 /DNA_ID= /DNA_START= /DNA_END= /DNA_ORIENTATION=
MIPTVCARRKSSRDTFAATPPAAPSGFGAFAETFGSS